MRLSEPYRRLNEELHRTRSTYGASGHRNVHLVRELMQRHDTTDVLDYGCGKATLSAQIGCRNYDPCIPRFSDEPEPADIVTCLDVLEHVEPACLQAVLEHLQSLTRVALLAVVATHPDRSKNLPDGSNPHRIVQPGHWWVETLGGYFRVTDHKEAEKDVTVWALR